MRSRIIAQQQFQLKGAAHNTMIILHADTYHRVDHQHQLRDPSLSSESAQASCQHNELQQQRPTLVDNYADYLQSDYPSRFLLYVLFRQKSIDELNSNS
jgi:hypothetical protein